MATGLRFADQDRTDVRLLGRGGERRLADRNADRIAARELKDAGPDQAVMDDDVGFLELALRLQREQLRVAWSCTHERDAADRRGGVIDKRSLELAGIGLGIAGKEGLANGAEEVTLPEGAAAIAM